MDRLDAAEATLKKAVSADPSDGQAMSLLGLLRFKQKKYEEALDTLTRAAQLDPDNPVTQNHLGILLSEKGQRAAAETAFRRAIQLQPEYGEAHCNLALVYALQRPPLPELARWHYQKAMTAGNPRKPELEKLLEPTAGASPAQ
jgi:Flp pilus assembly protein TadD